MFSFEELGKVIGDLGRIKEALKKLRVEVTEGPMSLTFDGLQEIVRVEIKPDALNNLALLEAKIGACFNKGVIESRLAAREEIERITGWNIPNIPGLI